MHRLQEPLNPGQPHGPASHSYIWRGRHVLFVAFLCAGLVFVLASLVLELGDVFRGSVTLTECPASIDTGRSCYLLDCGDRAGLSVCAPDSHCLCRPGYCAQASFCQLNATDLTASVVPVSRKRPLFPGQHGTVRTALCISGGGSRSMSSALGALRALESLGLMEKVDAISSVSGGSWAAALYMFANSSKETILGDYKKTWRPELLTMDFLRSQPTLLSSAASAPMGDFFKKDFSMHSKMQTVWARYVGRMVLANAGLDRVDAFMAGSEAAVHRIQRENPALRRQPFLVPHPDRPRVFVMNGAILAPIGSKAESTNVVSFQVSPDYTGSPFYPDNSRVEYPSDFEGREDKVWVGGGFVETFAFGGQAPEEPQQAGGSGVRLPAPKVPFTLMSALAISSAAFGKLANPFTGLGVKLDPEALIWPVSPDHQEARMFSMGDGGNLENAGLLAMLQRGASRIVWLVNTDVGISPREPFCKLQSTKEWDPYGKVTDQVTDKFGFGRDSGSTWLGQNQVFRAEDLPPLLCRAQRLMHEGKPVVLDAEHEVLPNDWWGIKGGYTARVLYVFNEGSRDFAHKLPKVTGELLAKGADGPFAHFPFYHTTFQNPPEFTALRPEQVTLLAALAEYGLLENAHLARAVLGAESQ